LDGAHRDRRDDRPGQGERPREQGAGSGYATALAAVPATRGSPDLAGHRARSRGTTRQVARAPVHGRRLQCSGSSPSRAGGRPELVNRPARRHMAAAMVGQRSRRPGQRGLVATRAVLARVG
jgi:hypothetical protein